MGSVTQGAVEAVQEIELYVGAEKDIDGDNGCWGCIRVEAKDSVQVEFRVNNETVFKGVFKVYGDGDCTGLNNELRRFGVRCVWGEK